MKVEHRFLIYIKAHVSMQLDKPHDPAPFSNVCNNSAAFMASTSFNIVPCLTSIHNHLKNLGIIEEASIFWIILTQDVDHPTHDVSLVNHLNVMNISLQSTETPLVANRKIVPY